MTRALSAAASSLPAAWGGTWLALAALWAFAVFGPQVAMRLGAAGHLPHGLAYLGLLLVLVFFKLMTLGALYRVALFGKDARKEGLGLGGVQFHMPEVRLFGAGIMVGLFMLLIAATLFVVFAIALKLTGLEGLADASPAHPWGVVDFSQPVFWFIVGYLVLSLVLLVFLTAKFALFHAATVAERRMVTLNALGLSSGNVGKLFAGLMVMILPLLVVACLLFHHMHRQFVLSPRPPALDTPHLHLVLHAVMAGLAIFAILPLAAGFLSSAYRQIIKLRSE